MISSDLRPSLQVDMSQPPYMTVTGGTIGKCGILDQLDWLLVHIII